MLSFIRRMKIWDSNIYMRSMEKIRYTKTDCIMNFLGKLFNYKSDDFIQDYYIINFKDIFSIPVSMAKKIACQNGKRLRLCPPYREHLSQAFARYFMRVGLPININMDE